MYVDPRGPRFGAWLTAAVLITILLTGSAVLAGAQAVIFALGAVSLRLQPWGLLFRAVVRPRLAPPAELEADGPPRFAQAVGLGFLLVATAGYALGWSTLGAVATGLALVAALLNAAFGLCLGCEVYLLVKRNTVRFLPASSLNKGVPV